MADFKTIKLERDGPVMHLTLNRPAQLNAINRQMLEDLWGVCDVIEGDPSVKVVTLEGEGRAFCAGADLTTVQEVSADPQRWEEFIRLWHRVFNRIEALPIPVVAGVHGMALAGGLELTMVCDLVIVDEEARLGDQHANFGLVAGGGGSQRLPRLIGLRRAKELMLLGHWLSTREALECGLINKAVPAGKLREDVNDLAGKLATLSGSANRTVKKLANRGLDLSLAEGLDLEIRAVGEHMQSADAREGLSAFIGKRRPKFSS